MPNFHCDKNALWGESIDVRGTIYKVAPGGFCENVSLEHAAVLSTFPGWTQLPEPEPVAESVKPEVEVMPATTSAFVKTDEPLDESVATGVEETKVSKRRR